ncbi:MAG: sigma-70 family RNA polymerase sigma factor [Oscillospiraceae bacterium]|nr:sigma-70 family RNA polymerase sigma factor [Oscillospiraceae bacterium]
MPYSDQNDETLVLLTLAGEQRAYEVLVARYEKAVIAAARGVTGNRHLAEDAAQDAFITAWMKLNLLREPSKYASWVCRIAKNCGKNMMIRFRSYMSIDDLENRVLDDVQSADPERLYVSSEEKELLRESIDGLPEKVRQVIYLHYFEDLSIAEIAERMRISAGTVKWQLHDGRKRIRKELCAMNEEMNDTLVRRVMKKVEELKLWQLKNRKTGFETVYRDVLSEVEELPESNSRDKYHALADVLMRGWWWLPGDKNDALFERIRDAAERGHNDEVMAFVAAREDEKLSGEAKAEFIRDHQIPRLEQGGFTKALASEWYWLGYTYCKLNQREKGYEAYGKVLSLLPPSDVYHASALAAIEMEKRYEAEGYAEKREKSYLLGTGGDIFRVIDGTLRRWEGRGYGHGNLYAADRDGDHVFWNASRCDGYFTVKGLAVGETHTGSDGTTLTFASADETAETPCGTFTGCELWVTRYGGTVCRTYFKEGVGIVKQERIRVGVSETRTLKDYRVSGGKAPEGRGLLPCAKGNFWVYTAGHDPDALRQDSRFEVCYADETTVTLTEQYRIERLKYDDNVWVDMIQQIRNEYWQEGDGGRHIIADVSHAVERAQVLAKTPMEKAHTKAACSVVQRIMDTDPHFNPSCTATGHWNFFQRRLAEKREGSVGYTGDFRWSFEWKNTGGYGEADTPLLFNDVYEMLFDATGSLWSDAWVIGETRTEEVLRYGDTTVKTVMRCEDGGTVTTKAGTFENCMRILLDISGPQYGLAYRGGKKEYYFAPGVGIIKTVNYYCEGARQTVYELTAYEGTGEGYFPLCDGMTRRYEAIGLTDGFVGSADYTYVADEEGNIIIFEDRCGIRNKVENITQYSSILGEIVEDQLWEEGKLDESRLRHDVNNFHLLNHFLGRTTRYWAAPARSVAWNTYRMKLLETLGEGGEVPRAWAGYHAITCVRLACGLFGCGRNEEGYACLERALTLYPKWLAIPDGELLEVGDELIFGGVKVVKGKEWMQLPDGKAEPLSYGWLFTHNSGELYYALTAPHGWEWFDGVRKEERYQQIVERAKKLMESK